MITDGFIRTDKTKWRSKHIRRLFTLSRSLVMICTSVSLLLVIKHKPVVQSQRFFIENWLYYKERKWIPLDFPNLRWKLALSITHDLSFMSGNTWTMPSKDSTSNPMISLPQSIRLFRICNNLNKLSKYEATSWLFIWVVSFRARAGISITWSSLYSDKKAWKSASSPGNANVFGTRSRASCFSWRNYEQNDLFDYSINGFLSWNYLHSANSIRPNSRLV